MIYCSCLYQKDDHFQLKIRVRKISWMEGGNRKRVRELGTEAEKQREERCGIEKKKKKGKEEVWYISC